MVRFSSYAVLVLSLIGSCSLATAKKTAGSSSDHPLTSSLSSTVSKVIQSSGGATDNLILGENEEATESLEVSIPLSQSPALHMGRDAPLMRDINMLSDILVDLVRQEDPKMHDLYEEFVQYGRQRYVLFFLSLVD